MGGGGPRPRADTAPGPLVRVSSATLREAMAEVRRFGERHVIELRLLAAAGGFASHWLHLCIGSFFRQSRLPTELLGLWFVALNVFRGLAVSLSEAPLRLAALDAVAAAACFASAAFLRRDGPRAWLVFPLATIGALDPLACVQVRLREHAMASDPHWRDRADQQVWTAFNAGLVASFSGGLIYDALGLRFLGGWLGAFAAGLAVVHLRHAWCFDGAPADAAADAASRVLGRKPSKIRGAHMAAFLAMACPSASSASRTGLTGTVMGVKACVVCTMAATYVTTANWQLAGSYYHDDLGKGPVPVFVVLVATTVCIVYGGAAQRKSLGCLMTTPRGSHGPELLLWSLFASISAHAVLLAAAAYGVRHGGAYVQMVSHGVAEFYVDLVLRCSHRVLDATCESANRRYEDYATVREYAKILARLYASAAAPLLYFYVAPTAPFVVNVAVCAGAMAYAGEVFLHNLTGTIHHVCSTLSESRLDLGADGGADDDEKIALFMSRKDVSHVAILGPEAVGGLDDAAKVSPALAALAGVLKDSMMRRERRSGRLRVSLDDDEVAALTKAFDAARRASGDPDARGIGSDQVEAILKATGASDADAARLRASADEDHDGVVDVDEFLHLAASARALASREPSFTSTVRSTHRLRPQLERQQSVTSIVRSTSRFLKKPTRGSLKDVVAPPAPR